MPEIPVGAQIFDVVFHPTFSTVYTGLLTGFVKAFSYDDQGNHKPAFSVRPSKSSCRGLSLDQDGSHLYAVGKGKSLKYVIQSLWLWLSPYLEFCFQHHRYSYRDHWYAQSSSWVSFRHLMPVSPSWYFSGLKLHHKSSEASYALAFVHRRRWWYYKGAIMSRSLRESADNAFIQLWDSRKRDCIRTYTQHSDYITDFLWLDDKKQLVATRCVIWIFIIVRFIFLFLGSIAETARCLSWISGRKNQIL